MSRAKQITAILGGALLALTFTTQPSSAAVNAAPSPGASGQLVVQTDNTADLRARFETSAATASVVGRKASPTRDVVEIAVGSTKITADRDLATGKATWSMGGATMTDRDRATLASMVSATSAWRTSGATDKTTGATKQSGGLKDLASRLLMLSAEAPSGVAIGTQTVDRPSERRLEKSAGSISVVIDAKASKATPVWPTSWRQRRQKRPSVRLPWPPVSSRTRTASSTSAVARQRPGGSCMTPPDTAWWARASPPVLGRANAWANAAPAATA